LIDADGWDAFNVTEDADLDYRLARLGWTSAVIAPPTWEEAPISLAAWLRQRTRWIKGHQQTWLVAMRAPAATARELGLGGFVALTALLGGGLLAAFLHGPLALILLAAVAPDGGLAQADWVLAGVGYASAAFAALIAALSARDWRFALAALTMPFYWPLTSLVALWALVELVTAPFYWAKTTHGLCRRDGPGNKFSADVC
jgi:cellulose synthase/poly-beta-1,6-N-acetylglucosamine synthase-like glycosyltransferase